MCISSWKWTTLLPLVVLLSVSSLAQQDPCPRRTILMNVSDRYGNSLSGQTAEHFRAKLGGHPIKVLSANLEIRPTRIVVLLDISGSMLEPSAKWELARRAAADILSLAPPQDSFALLTFATTTEERLDFSAGRDAVAKTLSRLGRRPGDFSRANRGTALKDAILEGLKLLDPPQPGDVIYAITDGEDNRSRSSDRALRTAILSAGVRVFLLLLRDSMLPQEQTAAAQMADLSTISGGNTIIVNPPRLPFSLSGRSFGSILADDLLRELARATQTAYREMNATYRLEMELPQSLQQAQPLRIELVNEKGKQRNDVVLLYPHQLQPCSASRPSN